MYGYIYKIENLVNGKIYIGQTITKFEYRKRIHLKNLKNNTHYNQHLQRAFNKYGETNFKFSVLNWANNQEELNKFEEYYIINYNCLDRDKGYNLRHGGSNGKLSPETRERMCKAQKGHKVTYEQRLKLSKSKMGKKNHFYKRKLPLEEWIKLGFTFIGRKHSNETKQKLSKSKMGEKNPMYGVIRSLESRKKQSLNTKKRGLFGFKGTGLIKKRNPEKKCWQCYITINSKKKSLGTYNDPLSCEIVYFLVWNEIYS